MISFCDLSVAGLVPVHPRVRDGRPVLDVPLEIAEGSLSWKGKSWHRSWSLIRWWLTILLVVSSIESRPWRCLSVALMVLGASCLRVVLILFIWVFAFVLVLVLIVALALRTLFNRNNMSYKLPCLFESPPCWAFSRFSEGRR